MIRALMEKADNIQKQMGSIQKDENPKKKIKRKCPKPNKFPKLKF